MAYPHTLAPIDQRMAAGPASHLLIDRRGLPRAHNASEAYKHACVEKKIGLELRTRRVWTVRSNGEEGFGAGRWAM